MKTKKIAIIGGGISGLTAGIYARRAGFEAEIYEKHSIPGGECTGWDRQGYHIDNCIHWMIGTTPGTALNRLWNDVGALGEGVEVISADNMYTSELNGQRVTLWQDIDRTERELVALSPVDEAEIKSLMRYARMAKHIEIPAETPMELMGPMAMIRMASAAKDMLKIRKAYHGMDTADLMARFHSPLIRCMISDFCPKESPGYSFAVTYGNFISGDGGIPRGGSRAMALRIAGKFADMGGSLFTNAAVKRIDLSDGRAAGLTLEDGRTVSADYIICSCDPSFTFSRLLDASYMDTVLREVYANRKDYPVYGMFQAAYAVDDAADALRGELMTGCEDIIAGDWMGSRMTIKTYAYEPGFAPPGKQILQVLIGLKEEAFDYWSALNADKECYRKKKLELAQAVREKLEARFPEYTGKLSLLDVWTPVSYQRYCNAFKGYNQAFIITKNSMKNPYPSAYIKGLDNVLLAGQWLSPPGGLPGAAIQGRFAIQRILHKEKRSLDI